MATDCFLHNSKIAGKHLVSRSPKHRAHKYLIHHAFLVALEDEW